MYTVKRYICNRLGVSGSTHKQHWWCLILGLFGSPRHGESLLSSGASTGLIQSLQSKYTIILQVWRIPPEQWYWYRSYAIITIQLHNNTSGMENASWELVLIPVLSIYSFIHINPYYPSRPGKHPSSEPNHASARFIIYSRPRKTPTIRTEPYSCAVIFSPGGNTHQPNRTAHLQCGCRRASGASQIACLGSGKPPTRRTSFP